MDVARDDRSSALRLFEREAGEGEELGVERRLAIVRQRITGPMRLECADERLHAWRGSLSEVALSAGSHDSNHSSHPYRRPCGQTTTMRRTDSVRGAR